MNSSPHLVIFLTPLRALVDGHDGLEAAAGFPAARLAVTHWQVPDGEVAGFVLGRVVDTRAGMMGESCPVAAGDTVRLTGWGAADHEADVETVTPPPVGAMTAAEASDRQSRVRRLRGHVRETWVYGPTVEAGEPVE